MLAISLEEWSRRVNINIIVSITAIMAKLVDLSIVLRSDVNISLIEEDGYRTQNFLRKELDALIKCTDLDKF